MGLRRLYRDWAIRTAKRIAYRGITVPLTGDHMIRPVVVQLFSDAYEVPEITALQAVVRPGDRVLELGTGLGIVTALAARAAQGGKVLTFEANPALIAPAAALFSQNQIGNVEARHGVITDGPGGGTLSFHLAEFFPEGSLAKKGVGVIEVPTWSAAETVKDFHPDVLICDIEGAEGDLLPALDLSSLRAAVIELHPHILSGTAVARIYGHLFQHGLFPAIEHSSGTVVVFQRTEQPQT